MTDDELVELFSTGDSTEAEILRVALENEGIACQIGDENQGGLTGLNSFEIKLLVRSGDLQRARQFLDDHQQKQSGDD